MRFPIRSIKFYDNDADRKTVASHGDLFEAENAEVAFLIIQQTQKQRSQTRLRISTASVSTIRNAKKDEEDP